MVRVWTLRLFTTLIGPLLLFSAASVSNAQSDAEQTDPAIDWIYGPDAAEIGNIGQLQLPEGYMFTGKEGTQWLMEYMENPLTGLEVGLAAEENSTWLVVFEFDPIGFVKDDDRDELDPDALFEVLLEGQKEGNKERKKRGWGALTLVDWAVEPHYDPETNNLEWGTKIVSDDGDTSVNYMSRLLGRYGVMDAILVTGADSFYTQLPAFRELLTGYTFKSGNTYAEFREGDKIAEYGLVALVAGGAGALAAKSGIFKWLWKLIVVALAGAGAFFKKIFKRNKGPQPPPGAIT